MITALALAASLTLFDLEGRAVQPLAERAARAIVFVFVERDCPLGNRYAPELNRLHAEYAGKGVRVWLVYPGPVNPDRLRAHRLEYSLAAPALLDPDYVLADAVGASIAPEAAVFTPDGVLAYRGRIDDRAISLRAMRPAPRRRDLAQAIERLLQEPRAPAVVTRAVGCYLRPLR